MGVGTYERKTFVGGAPATTVSGALTDSATSLTIAAATGWPSADTNPFVAVIDRGTASEEKILVGARTGTSLSSITRGYDDTSAAAHDDGAAIEHVLDASTIDQANRLANLMDAKGEIIAFNGTNPVAVSGTAQADDGEDGYALVVNNAEATGLAFERPIHLYDAATTPALAAVPRLWYDQNQNIIRSSDGSAWKIPAQVLVFANDTARDAYLGATPTNDGHFCFTGTGGTLRPQIWDGTTWVSIPRLDEAIPTFADTTARDAFYTAPTTGNHAYITGTHQLLEYREDEWILLNQKIVTSETAPTSPHEGDVWLQPSS